MIEVEKKFIFTSSQKTTLLQEAKFLREIKFTDTYYDTPDYKLTTKDQWLRKRNQDFQLKIPLSISNQTQLDQYKEITDIQEIKKFLKLDLHSDLESQLTNQKISPFCKCHTTRTKYQKDKFIIDLDTVQYQDFQYNIGEIELMVKSEAQVPQAVQDILNFAKSLHLEIAPVRGKVLHYLKTKRPDHYQAILDSYK